MYALWIVHTTSCTYAICLKYALDFPMPFAHAADQFLFPQFICAILWFHFHFPNNFRHLPKLLLKFCPFSSVFALNLVLFSSFNLDCCINTRVFKRNAYKLFRSIASAFLIPKWSFLFGERIKLINCMWNMGFSTL